MIPLYVIQHRILDFISALVAYNPRYEGDMLCYEREESWLFRIPKRSKCREEVRDYQMDASSYRLNFDLGVKNEIHHYS